MCQEGGTLPLIVSTYKILNEAKNLLPAEWCTYEVWLKNNGTGRPADMVEGPQTSETHNINL